MLIPKIKSHFIDKETRCLHIKFSADGAQIIKHKEILNEGKIAETATGNYTCCLFDISKEDYETMYTCLAEIKTEIDNLKELEIDGCVYKIEQFIGGNLKMLAIIYGINRATANCPCIWCVWDKRKLVNKDIDKVEEEIKKEWSIIKTEKGARTLSDSISSVGSNGYVNVPIFNIPFHRIVIDTLHLFLRITDVLYDLLIKDLRQIDGKQKKRPIFQLNHICVNFSQTYLRTTKFGDLFMLMVII